MWRIFLLSFREYFEAFLLIASFNVVCINYNLRRIREIFFGASLGLIIPIFLTINLFLNGRRIHELLTENQTDKIEGWLLVFSAILIAILAFPVHSYVWGKLERQLKEIYIRIRKKSSFDWLLFFLVFLLVGKESMEALVFTSGASLENSFLTNLQGLILGFLSAAICGYIFAYTMISLRLEKFFKVIAFFVLFMAGVLLREGTSMIFAWPEPVPSLIGLLYICIIYFLFIREKNEKLTKPIL